jgi:hypothetical protein
MMKGWKMDYRTADIHDGAVRKIGEQNFSLRDIKMVILVWGVRIRM